MARVGVLLTAYGGPRRLEEIAPFMESIMGVEPTEAVLKDAHRRYLTIGGLSPLPSMAERIAVQLERSLSGLEAAEDEGEGGGLGFLGLPAPLPRATDGVRIPVAAGMLHSGPSIASAVDSLASSGVRSIVMLSLSPFDTACTTGKYRVAVDAAVSMHDGIRVIEAAKYHTSTPFVTACADNLSAALQTEELAGRRALVVFSAHSLPVEEVADDPCYVDQLKETAGEVALRASLGAADGFDAIPEIDAFGGHSGLTPWLLAYQSKGKRGGDWIGPDLGDVIDAAAAHDFGAVVVSPLGFAVDHLETLYDLDVAAAERAFAAEMEFARAAAPNDSADLVDALAEAVRKVI